MKKLLLVGFIVLSVVFITACTSGTQEETTIKTNEEIISMQVLTVATLMPKSSNEELSSNSNGYIMKLTEEVTEEDTEVDTEEDTEETEDLQPNLVVDQIEPYIELVEQYLGSNEGLDVVVESSNLGEYEWMMRFETKSLLGETQQYIIHYNMTLEDEDDEESEFSLVGIMIVGEETYQLTGEREVEIDQEELEFIAKLDDDNYVESSYSVENDEIEFEIKIVQNGEIISETSLEIEYEEDETNIELDFVDGANTGTYEFTYEIENDVPVLVIQFDVTIDDIREFGEMTLSIHTDDVTGQTYYMLYMETEEETYEQRYERDLEEEA